MKLLNLVLSASLAGVVASHAQLVPGSPEQLAEGKKNYMLICVACHQPTGLGLPAVFPPLVGTEYVTGSPERLIAMLLKGNAGPIVVNGKPFNNIMPGQEAMLNDEKMAAIGTYVRQSWGNSASPISAAEVAAARAKFKNRKAPWTEPELKAWKDEATPGGTAAPAPATGAAPATGSTPGVTPPDTTAPAANPPPGATGTAPNTASPTAQ